MDQKKKMEKREINQAVDETSASEGATKPRSLRLSADTMDDLGTLKKAMGAHNMDEAVRAILNTFSMSKIKEIIPERAAEINEFEVMCRKIINAYTHSLVLFGDAENRAQEQVKDKIDGLNDTIARLSQLQTQSEQQVSELKEANQRLVAELSHVNAERDALAAELSTLKKAEHLDATIISKVDELQKQISELLQPKDVLV